MIQNLIVSGVHSDVDEDLKKYVQKKIGNLDRYMSRHARKSAHVEVRLKESHAKDKKSCTCEAVMHLPHDILTTQESTLNMYAAVDIVEEKLHNQLIKYKMMHEQSKLRHRFHFHRKLQKTPKTEKLPEN